MNKQEIMDDTTALIGDISPSLVIPPESLADAVAWAQEELARRLGVTYVESDPIPVVDGIVVLPDDLVKPVRVWAV
jgi:hypothetical protein